MRIKYPRSLVLALALGVVLGASPLSAQTSSSSAASTPPNAPGEPTRSTIVDFTPKAGFPNFVNTYTAPFIPEAPMSNSERIHSLMRDGKLELSLEDVIDLTLENNLDIAYTRYQLPFAQTDYLRAKSGGATRGVAGAFQSNALFAGAIGGGVSGFSGGVGGGGGVTGGGGATNVGSQGCCDPFTGLSFGWDRRSSPLNFTVVSGVPVVTTQQSSLQGFFGQGFLSGTSYVVALGGLRQSSSSITPLFNPEVSSGLTVGINQHLLNGFGYRANAKFIRQARNELKISDSVFRQQVITTVAQVVNLYSDLLYYRENIRVAQQALNYAQKLLGDNKKQVEIGTLAPIEVVRAESEVAARQQDLIVAQTGYQQQQELLKTAISKRVDTDLATVQIEATDKLPKPKPDDVPPLTEALRLASKNRPEIEQADLNIRNQEITIQSTHNSLLPTFDVFATYAPAGLSGNRIVEGSCPTQTVLFQGACFTPGQSFPPTLVSALPIVGTQQAGAGQALSQLFHGRFPDYSFGASLTIPLRNRSAQADAARALYEERQLRTDLQRKKNQVEQDVRNAEIAVTQAKAQIEAAEKAVILAQQTLDAEQKKFQLGESTVFQVIQAQRDLATQEGNQAKARSTYAKALTQYQQATATILDKYNIQIASAKSGHVSRPPNIPGAPEPATPVASPAGGNQGAAQQNQ